uniref:Uncharacterized protein n=1 Tax=Trichogramma kaykai TaxID=54128 RepID=A0ABD2X088_9HYME
MEYVTIVFVAESEEKLKEKIKNAKRIVKAPKKLLETASDLSIIKQPVRESTKKKEQSKTQSILDSQLTKLKDEKQGWINCLLATRAIMCHDEVPPKLQELVWESMNTLLSTLDGVYAGPRCHEETWEPEEEGICPICHRLFSSPPPPVGPWILAGSWD